MADDKPVSLLLDAIAAATTAKAHQEAEMEAAEAVKRAADAAEAEAEAESVDESWDGEGERPKRPAWLGRSAAELLAGREGRINSTNDVHTGGAKVIDDDE